MVPPGIQLFRALYSGLDAAAHGSLSNSTSAAGQRGTESDPCRIIPEGRISKRVYSRSGSTSSGPEEVAPGAPAAALTGEIPVLAALGFISDFRKAWSPSALSALSIWVWMPACWLVHALLNRSVAWAFAGFFSLSGTLLSILTATAPNVWIPTSRPFSVSVNAWTIVKLKFTGSGMTVGLLSQPKVTCTGIVSRMAPVPGTPAQDSKVSSTGLSTNWTVAASTLT